MQRGKTTSGFTLVELLIVIGILSLLAGVLFPVFAQSRESGRRTVCTSQLRQLGVAALMYIEDYGGDEKRSSGEHFPLPYRIEPLLPYTKDKRIFVCPKDPTEWGYGYSALSGGNAGKIPAGTTVKYSYAYIGEPLSANPSGLWDWSGKMAFFADQLHGEPMKTNAYLEFDANGSEKMPLTSRPVYDGFRLRVMPDGSLKTDVARLSEGSWGTWDALLDKGTESGPK